MSDGPYSSEEDRLASGIPSDAPNATAVRQVSSRVTVDFQDVEFRRTPCEGASSSRLVRGGRNYGGSSEFEDKRLSMINKSWSDHLNPFKNPLISSIPNGLHDVDPELDLVTREISLNKVKSTKDIGSSFHNLLEFGKLPPNISGYAAMEKSVGFILT